MSAKAAGGKDARRSLGTVLGSRLQTVGGHMALCGLSSGEGSHCTTASLALHPAPTVCPSGPQVVGSGLERWGGGEEGQSGLSLQEAGDGTAEVWLEGLEPISPFGVNFLKKEGGPSPHPVW